MKKTPLRKVSSKQKAELQLRNYYKDLFFEVCGNTCMTCKGRNTDWRGLSLSHIIPLSGGGKTTLDNILWECYPDHERYEKRSWLRKEIKEVNEVVQVP